MLKTTIELIEHLKRNKTERELTLINSLVYSIVACGDKRDADAVLNQYLSNPSDFHYSYLLQVFKKWGDHSVAEQLFNASIFKNKLKENAEPEILEVLGHLKYAPIKKTLADYIFENPEPDYYISKNAVLGLIHFDCHEYQNEIEMEIEKCYGKNLFPVFVPALVCKLTDRKSILENLYKLGNEFASTDCNAGIVLGFSLCGEEGRPFLKRVLFDPNWETDSTGTGTVHFAYEGLKNLGVTFMELYQEIKSISDEGKLKNSLGVLFALLDRSIEDIEINKKESFADIYTALFKWKNDRESDNIIDLAERVGKMEDAYKIEKLLELKMKEEAIFKNFIR